MNKLTFSIIVGLAILFLSNTQSLVGWEFVFAICTVTLIVKVTSKIFHHVIKTDSRFKPQVFNYYHQRLKQSLKPEDRQQLIDTLIALNLLQGNDLSGLDLSNANFNQASLDNLNLSITKLMNANFGGASLKYTNFSYANLSYAVLRETDLREANLHGATFDHSDFHGSNLQGVNLSAASLQDTDLSDTNLSHANLRFADLTGSNLVGVNLAGANLEHCILPDGSEWSSTTDMKRFVSAEHTMVDVSYFLAQILSRTAINKTNNLAHFE